LDLDEDQDWIFVVRNRNGKVVMEYTLVDLPYTWNTRLVEGTLVIGHEDAEESIIGDAFHVSAERLQSKSPPSTLKKALVTGNPNAPIWDESYNEEYDGLTKLDTFKVLTKAQYVALPNRPKAIPTICVLTVKVDKWHRPVRAKARTVVLGTLEDRAWTKADCYASVLRQDSLRLLISIAVQVGCVAKQGDCKNAFCQPRLPDNKVVIIKPPPGCPQSEPFSYWKLQKTLYGPRRSPRHWYDTGTRTSRSTSSPSDSKPVRMTRVFFLAITLDIPTTQSMSDAMLTASSTSLPIAASNNGLKHP
jgi:hypothetical protein